MTGQLALGSVDTLPVNRREGLSQWFTRPALASRIVRWCGDIRSMTILEPSAGSGSLVRAIEQEAPSARVVAHEVDPEWAEYLRATTGAAVIEGDFLAAPRPKRLYDLGILNPPFEGGLDVDFVVHAMTQVRRLVSVVRSVALHGKRAHREIVNARGWGLVSEAKMVGRQSFDGPVDGPARHDFSVIKLSRGYTGPSHVEFWS